MNRSRTALAIAAGVAAGVTVVAFVAVATNRPHGSRGGHSVSADAGDDLELQALSQVQGDPTSPSTDPSPSGAPPQGGWGQGGPGKRGLGGGLLGGGILHGDVVVAGKDGKAVTVAIQRGTVTSVGTGTLVVRSSDGFSQTWTTADTTRYGLGSFGRGRWNDGPRPLASSAPSGSPTTSGPGVVKGAEVLVLGRTTGSGKPSARLVVGLADGLGAGRWGPGWDGPRPHGPARLPAA